MMRTGILIFLALTLAVTGTTAAAQSLTGERDPARSLGSRAAPTDTTPRSLEAMRTEARQLEQQRAAAVLRLEQTLTRLRAENVSRRGGKAPASRGASPGKQRNSTQNWAAALSEQASFLRQQIAGIDRRRQALLLELRQREMQQAAATGAAVALRATWRLPASEPTSVYRLVAPGEEIPHDYYLSTSPPGDAYGYSVQQVDTARRHVAAAELELKAAEEALHTRKQMVDQGLARESELSPLRAQQARAQAALEDRKNLLETAQQADEKRERIAQLQRPIDVELREAPVRQAAQAMSQAAGMGIEVEPSVPAETRLTVVARGVPLATVLDAVARQSGLMIAPKEDGVLLKPAPSLEINGQRTRFMSPFAPWSSEWGINPAAVSGPAGTFSRGSSGYGGGAPLRSALLNAMAAPASSLTPRTGQNQPAAAAPEAASGLHQAIPRNSRRPATGSALNPVSPSATPPEAGRWVLVRPPYGQNLPGSSGYPGGGAAPVAISSIGDNAIVVAHPAATPEGEPAVKLTVYRLDGDRLREVTSSLHPIPRSTAGPGGPLIIPSRGRSVPGSAQPSSPGQGPAKRQSGTRPQPAPPPVVR